MLATYKKAVGLLNTRGRQEAAKAYKVLSTQNNNVQLEQGRQALLNNLTPVGRVWYSIASVENYAKVRKLQYNTYSTAFGGIRTMVAFKNTGKYYLVAVDTSVDANTGVVVTQWVTRQPIMPENVETLLKLGNQKLKDTELSSDYFTKYSTINARTRAGIKTPQSMEDLVLQRLLNKMKNPTG